LGQLFCLLALRKKQPELARSQPAELVAEFPQKSPFAHEFRGESSLPGAGDALLETLSGSHCDPTSFARSWLPPNYDIHVAVEGS
jgi:hypothetical protein